MGVIATSTLAGSEDAVVVETALVVRVFASLLARSALVIIPTQCSAACQGVFYCSQTGAS
jgi:hypothetical protein